MSDREDFRTRLSMVVVSLAAFSALWLAGCSGSTDPEVAEGTVASVVLSPDGWRPPTPTEAEILADRLMRRNDDSLLLDEAERSGLADEIAMVLSTLRGAYPAVADVTVAESYAFGELLLGLESQLIETVVSLLEGGTGPVALDTGYAEFDALNASLGLSVIINFYRASGIAHFFFSDRLNVPAAAAAYERVEGVEYAEANAILGDGPDVEALRSEDRWYVVARRAWGDCPSGCINEELIFFIVQDAAVDMIAREAAMATDEFRELVVNRGWQ